MTEMISITDLDVDALRHIMLLLARSPDGASSFARALSVSKSFLEFGNDTEILKSVTFENCEYPESFWAINSLLTRCACSGNLQACGILLKYLAARMKVLNQKCVDAEINASLARAMWDAHFIISTPLTKGAAEWATEQHERSSMEVEREREEIMKHLLVVISGDI